MRVFCSVPGERALKLAQLISGETLLRGRPRSGLPKSVFSVPGPTTPGQLLSPAPRDGAVFLPGGAVVILVSQAELLLLHGLGEADLRLV